MSANRSDKKKNNEINVLMVVTSHQQLGDSGRQTGLWLEEFAAPYYEFIDAGVSVVVASPKGGPAPIDPSSDLDTAQTFATARFHTDEAAKRVIATTARLEDMRAESFDAVFYPGGHGPMWDLMDDHASLRLLADFVGEAKPVVAVCHGPIALVNLKTDDGSYFLTDRAVTGFSNSEERAVGLYEVVPQLLEDLLIERRARYSKAETDFEPFVVVDGMLITGQNPASSSESAKALLEMLKVTSP
jgi:putative intracellular protease/amidase